VVAGYGKLFWTGGEESGGETDQRTTCAQTKPTNHQPSSPHSPKNSQEQQKQGKKHMATHCPLIRSTWLHTLAHSLIQQYLTKNKNQTPVVTVHKTVQVIRHHPPQPAAAAAATHEKNSNGQGKEREGEESQIYIQISDTEYWCEAVLSTEAQKLHHA